MGLPAGFPPTRIGCGLIASDASDGRWRLVGLNGPAPGAARLHLAGGVALLRPEEQVFTAMLAGFANQPLARNPARTTVEGREKTVRAFAPHVNSYPWQLAPAIVAGGLG